MKRAIYTKALTISLSRELYSAIKKVSDERFISMAQVVREIVEKAFSENGDVEKFNQAESKIKHSGRER